MIQDFSDLDVYQLAKQLYPKVVKLARGFSPISFHLRDQICRAANSISANIAEGFGRSTAEFKNYLTRAIGSENELKSHFEDAFAVEEITRKQFDEIIEEINILGKKLYTLRKNWK